MYIHVVHLGIEEGEGRGGQPKEGDRAVAGHRRAGQKAAGIGPLKTQDKSSGRPIVLF